MIKTQDLCSSRTLSSCQVSSIKTWRCPTFVANPFGRKLFIPFILLFVSLYSSPSRTQEHLLLCIQFVLYLVRLRHDITLLLIFFASFFLRMFSSTVCRNQSHLSLSLRSGIKYFLRTIFVFVCIFPSELTSFFKEFDYI